MSTLKSFPLVCCFLTSSLFSHQYDLEVRVGLSHLTKTLLNDIYGKAAFDAELEAHYQPNRYVGYFVNLSNFYKKGYTPDFDNPTHLNNLSLSIGPKFYFPLHCSPCLTPYLGAGFTGTWIHIHDQGDNIISYFDKGAFGPCFKSGVILNRSRFYVDIFFDYYIGYVKNYEQEYVNFSNLRSGVGLGYKF